MSYKFQEAQRRAKSDIHTLIKAAEGLIRTPIIMIDDLDFPLAHLCNIIVSDDSSSTLSPTIISLLRAGAIKRLNRIVKDMSEFECQSPEEFIMEERPVRS